MHNIKALEEEWKRYNRKKKRPLIVLLIVIVLVVLAMVVIMETDMMDRYRNSAIKKTSPVVLAQAEKVYIDGSLTALENREREPVLSIDAPMDAEDTMIDSVKKVPRRVKKKIHIEVIDAGSKRNSLKEVEKRFRLAPDTDDSLFLARSYYQKRNYKKAEYWALQTNKLNDNIEESWLIFAKAKVKRGHKNEAIGILNAYINRTNSVEAKVLLEKIKKGSL